MAGPGLMSGLRIAGGLMDAGVAARDDVTRLYDQQARLGAGRAVSAGDYAGAASALAGRGMFADAGRLSSEATTRAALMAADGGDLPGAQTIAAQGGDADLYAGLQGDEAKEAKERAEWLGQAADALKAVPLANRQQTFQQHVAPVLKSMGLDDAAIGQINASSLSDESLDAFRTTLSGVGAMNIQKTDGGDIIGIDPKTGKVQQIYQGGGKHEWREVKNADGSSYFIDLNAEGDGAPVSAGRPEIQPGPAGGGVPRSVRNNNPGNIEDGEFAKGLPGYKGSDGRFAIFESPEAGTNAQVALLKSYGRRGFDTVDEIIGRWAPTSDGNPTQAYADFVAKKVGVGRGERLNLDNPDVARKVADAIRQFEAGPLTASNPPTGRSASRVKGSEATNETVVTLSPDQVSALGLPAGAVVQRKKDGSLSVVNKPPTSNEKITEGQRTSANFAYRMLGSNDTLNQLYDQGIVKPTAQVLVSERNGVARLVARNPKDAQFVQAAQEWIMAKLRKESGAAIGVQELANDMQTYFPEPGDNAELIAQKAASRERTMRSFLNQGKAAFEEDYGEIPKDIEVKSPGKPPAGAKKAPNGGWHIEDPNKKGSFPALQKTPDGRWVIKSAAGWLEVK